MYAPTINYVLSSEVAITLYFQLQYAPQLQSKSRSRSITAVYLVATENTKGSKSIQPEGSHVMLMQIDTLHCQ